MLSYGRLPNADMSVINDVVGEYLNMLDIPATRHFKSLAPSPAPSPGLPGAAPQPRKEIPTQRTEFQRSAMEGRLSPAEK